jgi:hypothetical protein
MNMDRASVADADLPPPDPNGDPDRDPPAAGFGGDATGDPAWLKRRAALLERLAECGVELAGELPALAKAQSRLAEAVTACLGTAPQAGIAALGELAVTLHRGNVDFALMYERICRSVRRCIAMREQALPPPRTSAAAARQGAGAEAPRRRGSDKPAAEAARDPIAEAAKDMAAGRTGELDAEQLLGDLYDRPEDPTGMADLGLDRPLAELVAEICRDFGVDGREWAARLGLTDATTAAPEPGPRRKHAQDRRSPRQTGKDGVTPAAKGPPPAPPAATGQARSPDPPAVDPPRGRVDFGLRAANRRERRAAAKRMRKPPAAGSRVAPIAANDRSADSGCGPP